MEYNRLRDSLIKVAVAKQTRKSFLAELVKVDPLMEKVAANWEPTGMSAPVPKKGGLAGAGRRGLEWVKKNPWKAADYGLTALSVIPAVRIAGAGLRGANYLRKAYQARKLGAGSKYGKFLADAYRRHAGSSIKSMNPLSRGPFAGGKHVPGQFTNLGKGWGENWDMLRNPLGRGFRYMTGKLRQGVRLGTVGAAGEELYSGTRDIMKDYKAYKQRKKPVEIPTQWDRHPRSRDKKKIMPYPTGSYRQGKKLKGEALRKSPPPVHRGPWEKSPQNSRNR